MPTLIIESPSDGVAEPLNQSFQVSGQVTDKGMPEPVMIRSVTVQIDGGPEVRAQLKHVIDHFVTRYSYSALAQIEGGSGPHTLTVTATNENGITASKTETIFGQQVSDAPAILMDVLLPSAPDVSLFAYLIQALQNNLSPLATSLAPIGKQLIGPNIVSSKAADGTTTLLRIGLWIEDASFPVVAANNTYPLPRLSDAQAADGFAAAPPITQKDSTFAFSVSTAALQTFANAALASAGGGTGYSIGSVSVRTGAPSHVFTTVKGSAGGAGLEIDITETLGLKTQAGGAAAPAIDGSYSTSVGGTIDWFIPLLNLYMLGLWGLVSYESGGAVDQATGAAQAVLKNIPARIPFGKSLLPQAPDFPVVAISWKRFDATDASIEGAGYASVEARDQSTVAIVLDGTSEISEPVDEVTADAGAGYEYTLVDIAPDPDKFTWTVAGQIGATGAIDRTDFSQSDQFSATFRLPAATIPGSHKRIVDPGTYAFTLSVNATETCDTDSSRTLTAYAAMDVTVRVPSQPTPQPGHNPHQPL